MAKEESIGGNLNETGPTAKIWRFDSIDDFATWADARFSKDESLHGSIGNLWSIVTAESGVGRGIGMADAKRKAAVIADIKSKLSLSGINVDLSNF